MFIECGYIPFSQNRVTSLGKDVSGALLFWLSSYGVRGKILSLARFSHALPVGSMLSLAALLLVTGTAYGGNGGAAGTRWVGSWAASQQFVEPSNALTPEDLRDATLREIVHLSLGGTEIRLRLSNRFGTTPLHVTAAHVARPLSPTAARIAAGSDKAFTFSGSPEVTIPPHADYLSDPLSVPVNALSDVAITLHTDAAPTEQTGHPVHEPRPTSHMEI
jgi:hypothetical protein